MMALTLLRGLVIGLLVTGVTYYFFHDTIFGDWEKENAAKLAAAQKLEQENQQLAELEKRLGEIREEQMRLENAIRDLQSRLPNQEQFGQIIQDFTLAAKERQLTLSIQARPPAKREGVQSGQVQFSVDSVSEGGYQRVRSFADWIRDYPRLISFQRFEASVGNDGRIGLSGTCQTPVMFDILLPDPPSPSTFVPPAGTVPPERTGPVPGTNQAGTNQAGTNQAGTNQSGTNQAGTNPGGNSRGSVP